jgi:hypothetical protein
MATFVLIHGAGDSAWHRHLVEPERARPRRRDDGPSYDDDSAGLVRDEHV